jgi:hypothetical protein
MFGKYRKPKPNVVDDYMNSSFELGVKSGIKQAIDELRDIQKHDCRSLDEWEKAMVMQFLEQNNLEFGYNVIEGGFYILKRIR